MACCNGRTAGGSSTRRATPRRRPSSISRDPTTAVADMLLAVTPRQSSTTAGRARTGAAAVPALAGSVETLAVDTVHPATDGVRRPSRSHLSPASAHPGSPAQCLDLIRDGGRPSPNCSTRCMPTSRRRAAAGLWMLIGYLDFAAGGWGRLSKRCSGDVTHYRAV